MFKSSAIPSLVRCLGYTAVAVFSIGAPYALAGEGDVITYGAAQSLQYDSNLFRLPDDATKPSVGDKRQDWFSSTSLLLNVNKPFGRHVLTADIRHDFVRFQEYDQYNYQAADYRLGWKGDFGSDSTYALNYRRQRTLSSFADTTGDYKNIATRDDASGSSSLRVGGLWYVVGGIGVNKVTNSAAQEKASDNEGAYIEYGLRLDPRAGNWADLRLRNTHTSYDRPVSAGIYDNTYDQTDLRLSWYWQPSPASIMDGRIALIDRKHENLHDRDFSAWTAAVNYTWRPDPVASLKVGVYRNVGEITDYTATYATTHGISITPSWTPTAKLRFDGVWDWRRRRYEGDAYLGLPFLKRRETVRAVGLTATYFATRSVQLQAALRRETREGNLSSIQYTDNSATVSAQVLF